MSLGDALAHEWQVTIRNGGSLPTFPEGTTAKVVVVRPASEAEREQGFETVSVEQDATVDATSGMVRCKLKADCYGGAGLMRAAMRVISSGNTITVAHMTAQITDDAS